MLEEIKTAREWIGRNPVYLDTETTGLDRKAEVCQVAVIDNVGRVLVNSYVRPTAPIPPKATQIHGITNEDVKTAPVFIDFWNFVLHKILKDRLVIIYNRDYDLRIMEQSLNAYRWDATIDGIFAPVCAMMLYTDYRGQWDEYHGNNRWFKLEVACEVEKVSTAGVKPHDASGDCELTRRLVNYIAGQKLL